jgi:Fis family transcriptional regulator, factor for inversion stimulation protein
MFTVAMSPINEEIHESPLQAVTTSISLPDCVRDNLREYFADLEEMEPENLYAMLIHTVEKPLLEMVMERAQYNQTRAAQWLGMNRNTLRKKLQEHGLSD